MEDGEEDFLPPSSYVGTTGEVTCVAFDLAKQNLATVTSEGTVSVFRRTEQSEEWQYLTEWRTGKQFPLTQVQHSLLLCDVWCVWTFAGGVCCSQNLQTILQDRSNRDCLTSLW